MVALVALALLAPADDVKAVADRYGPRLATDRRNAAAVVGVWKDGKPHVFGYGTAYLRTGERTPDGTTVFAIGSITKAFTGILLADAVRRGEVDLDKPANDYLPADLKLPRKGDVPITLRHLAAHTSGLPVEPPLIGATALETRNPYADFDRPKLAKLLAGLTPKKPGKEEYSNLGAGMAGHALVHAAKAASFDQLVKERVCRPLGMADTGEALTGDQRARLARGHKPNGTPGPHWEYASMPAFGSLFSTADDLLKLAAAMVGGRETPLAETLKASRTPAKAGDAHAMFWVLDAGPPAAVWHNGGTYVTHAMLWVVPSSRTAVVVLSSRADEDVDDVAMKISKAIQPAGK